MTYQVRWARKALEMLKAITPKTAQREIYDAAGNLHSDPEAGKALHRELLGCWSIHAGHDRFRIIYKIEKPSKEIVVLTVGPRKPGETEDIYLITKKLLKARLLDEN